MKKLLVIIVCLSLFVGITSCNLNGGDPPPPSAQPIVGTWTINGIFLYYFDTPPDTENHIMNMTAIMNDNGTFSTSGTSQWEGSPDVVDMYGYGTYVYDEIAETLEMAYDYFEMDEVAGTLEDQICSCVIVGDVMTMTFNVIKPYTPAEPLIYIRQ